METENSDLSWEGPLTKKNRGKVIDMFFKHFAGKRCVVVTQKNRGCPEVSFKELSKNIFPLANEEKNSVGIKFHDTNGEEYQFETTLTGEEIRQPCPNGTPYFIFKDKSLTIITCYSEGSTLLMFTPVEHPIGSPVFCEEAYENEKFIRISKNRRPDSINREDLPIWFAKTTDGAKVCSALDPRILGKPVTVPAGEIVIIV